MKACKFYSAGFIFIILTCFCLSLFAAAGELDSTFGNDGRIATSVGNYNDQAYAVALQQDGKILVGGSSSNGADLDFALVRYNRDGTLDPTFNYDGTVTTQVGRDDDEIAALAVQDDGYIIAAGYSVQNGNRDFALVRYTPDGQRDPSFGMDGIAITEYGTLDDEITAITVDGDGHIVVAGYSTGTSGRAVIVGRYLFNGELDLSFGYEGLSLTGIGEDALARSIDVDDRGRIIVAGSYFHADRTEVMVLRFTETGDLDTTFGEEGLGLTGYIKDSTEGFGVKLHNSGAILVAGYVGMPGGLDAALFNFTADGQPDTGFGDNGMLKIEASLEDDKVLAVDVKDDVVSLSGFTTVNGIRQFLFISLQVSSPEKIKQEVTEIDSVPFILKTGGTTTSLRISEPQVEDSYEKYLAETADGITPLQTTVSQTAFGIFSNDTSYAIAVQPDGRAVAAGMSEENGVVTFAVARYESQVAGTAASSALADTPTTWISTKTPFEVTRTGAFSGGVITKAGITISKRGVVYSIAPDPVLKSGKDDGGNGGNGGDNDPPVVTINTPSNEEEFTAGTNPILSVTTDEIANCGYSSTDVVYNSMTVFSQTSSTTHSQTLTGLSNGQSYTYYVRCEDTSANQNTTSRQVKFSIASSATDNLSGNILVGGIAGTVSNFMVGTANAQTTTDNSGSSTTSIFSGSTNYVIEGFTEDGAGPGSYSSIITDLKPGTFYYVRAYALASDGTVYYGNQQGFKTADSCFIATAAYGSMLHSSVQLLRAFRDQYLMTNAPGRMFVKFYYKYSPPIADIIAGSTVLREIVRLLLLPLVGMSWLFLNLGLSGILFVAALFFLPYLVYRGAWRRA
ncbi:MAG: delta-60 repeat domain-containing protein [Desulfobulbaceae bacterium]|nr:delta-60 repeat domain-containing protein [Desulfobulbaceae bacterium]